MARIKYNKYIKMVGKQVHPDAMLSESTVSTIDRACHYLIQCIMGHVNRLRAARKSKTVNLRDVNSALRLSFPGELAKHAVSEATKSCLKYKESKDKKVKGSKAVSGAMRAGLMFSPSRVKHEMKNHNAGCKCLFGSCTSVAVAAAVEYIVTEILELSGNAARDSKRTIITIRHMRLAISNDEELSKLFRKFIAGGGVMPSIHMVLLQKPKASKPKASKPKVVKPKAPKAKAAGPKKPRAKKPKVPKA